jgi:hypothetical protein
LGGAYEEPENPYQAAISKIARQFMTKLHIQVNQTLQFYRGQQGGAAPQRLFLSGGASIMPYTAQFFAEKLNVPVEYFNPFRNLQISPAVNLEELSRVAHSLGEVVGLGLRNLATCPVEMNLMPDSTLRWQSFNQKKPYLIATVVSMVLVTFAVGFLFQKLANNKSLEIDRLTPKLDEAQRKMDAFNSAYAKMQSTKKTAEGLAGLIEDRYYWGDFVAEMRRALIRSEDAVRKSYSSQKPGLDVGIWIDQLIGPAAGASQASPNGPVGAPGMGPGSMSARYGGAARYAVAQPQPDQSAQVVTANTNAVTLVCRAVSLKRTVSESANNKDIAYAVRDQIAASPMVDPSASATQLVGEISTDDANGTFTFTVTVTPLKPLKF